MANNKMTQKDYFNAIIALAKENNRQDIVDFAESRIEALNKKSSSKKPTKTQEENVALKSAIKDVLASASTGMTISEVIKASDALAGLSNQKVSALMIQLVKEGSVEKYVDKKRSLFSLVGEVEADEVEEEV